MRAPDIYNHAVLELMDNIGIRAVNRAINLELPKVVILFEADGKVKDGI